MDEAVNYSEVSLTGIYRGTLYCYEAEGRKLLTDKQDEPFLRSCDPSPVDKSLDKKCRAYRYAEGQTTPTGILCVVLDERRRCW